MIAAKTHLALALRNGIRCLIHGETAEPHSIKCKRNALNTVSTALMESLECPIATSDRARSATPAARRLRAYKFDRQLSIAQTCQALYTDHPARLHIPRRPLDSVPLAVTRELRIIRHSVMHHRENLRPFACWSRKARKAGGPKPDLDRESAN